MKLTRTGVTQLALFAIISMILLAFLRPTTMGTGYRVLGVGSLPTPLRRVLTPPDPKMAGIYVPPAQFSHPKCCAEAGRLGVPNTWRNLAPDNNIPGLLPGPRVGETLGLENQPELSLESPIRAPLVDNPSSFSQTQQCSDSHPASPAVLDCLNKAINNSQTPTLNSEGYFRRRFEQCNPYGGSYCQCTNNYIPLPTVGYCQPYNRGMEVCPYPYKVAPADVYMKTMKCLAEKAKK